MKSIFMVLALVPIMLAALPGQAWAKHPVRDIPVMVVAADTGGGSNTSAVYARAIEWANRAYGHVGIQFTFDEYAGINILGAGNTLNCYGDDATGDKSQGNWYASLNLVQRGAVTILSRRYEAVPEVGCIYSCSTTADCCPGSYDADAGSCMIDGEPSDFRCMNPDGTGGYCSVEGYTSPWPECFQPGSCTPKVPCTPRTGEPYFIKFPPLYDWHRIDSFDHEVGHFLGLRHTHDGATLRCYDTDKSQEPPDGTCNTPSTEPASCAGSHFACPADTPWRNVMSYHGGCRKQWGGYHVIGGDWNQAFSTSQRNLIWRTINELWDGPGNWLLMGGYENLYLLQANARSRYSARESAYSMNANAIADAGWTKYNATLLQGDFNGDGNLDVLATAIGGNHPGIAFYPVQWDGAIAYGQTLLSSSYLPDVYVAVGNFRGDRADDVLVVTPNGTYTFEGSTHVNSNAPLTLVGGGPSLVHTYPNSFPVIANFTGSWYRSLPISTTMQSIANYQTDITINGQYSNIGYDDVLMLYSDHAVGYAGTTNFSFSPQAFYTTLIRKDNYRFAANLTNDQHDEIAVLNGYRLEAILGQNTFNPAWVEWTSTRYFGTQQYPARFTVGNFRGNHYADWVVQDESGARLYDSTWETQWFRDDLRASNSRFAAIDTAAKGFDDVLISTPVGAFLYTGHVSQGLVGGFWDNWDPAYGYPSATWVGR